MRIIPVIDLKAGLVVRGVAGRRSEYRPVQSVLANGARPVTIGRAFVEKLNLREAYVADLDAIGGAEPAWDIYTELIACGLKLWVDAGITDLAGAHALSTFTSPSGPLHRIVSGLESLPDPDFLRELVGRVGAERLVFSLDLKNGMPLTTSTAWSGIQTQEIAELALDAGIRRMLVLDLARVGVGAGVGTEDLCRWLRAGRPDLEIIAGGGVRCRDDLTSLENTGCNAALVASALHDGRLTSRA